MAALLAESHALMQALFPPEENFHLDIAALRAPDIRFFAAFDGETCLGTGALALRDGYGEVKVDVRGRFRARARRRGCHPAPHRSRGRALGLTSLKLETGKGLDAAHRLYARHGFTRCGPFGSYPEAPGLGFPAKTTVTPGGDHP